MRNFNRVYLDARKVIRVRQLANGGWRARHPKIRIGRKAFDVVADGTMRDQALTRCAMMVAKKLVH